MFVAQVLIKHELELWILLKLTIVPTLSALAYTTLNRALLRSSSDNAPATKLLLPSE
jgi:hypothetical protein